MDYAEAVHILASEERAAIDYPDEMTDLEVCDDICRIVSARDSDPFAVVTPEAFGEERAEAFRVVFERYVTRTQES